MSMTRVEWGVPIFFFDFLCFSLQSRGLEEEEEFEEWNDDRDESLSLSLSMSFWSLSLEAFTFLCCTESISAFLSLVLAPSHVAYN